MTQLEQLLIALHDAQVEFIIVGGVAARAHGSSRLTDDLDVAYARSPANLARIVTARRKQTRKRADQIYMP